MTKIIQIKRLYTDAVLFECDAPEGLDSGLYARHALEQATAARNDLSDADLRGADLSDAYLRGANLSGANLIGANLRGANLLGADLSDANLIGADLSDANLRGANLSDAYLLGADLSDANLRGANLNGANLIGADLSDAPTIPNIHQTVYAAACVPGALNMGAWHCGTSHCRAGWVVTLAGEEGKALEEKIGTQLAATSIYMASDPDRWKAERLPNFYCGNEKALEDMKRMALEEAAKSA